MNNSRRTFLAQSVAVASCLALAKSAEAAPLRIPRERFGCLLLSYGIRARSDASFAEPSRFAAFCREHGFAGAQMAIKQRSADEARALRSAFEKTGVYIEGIVSPPKDAADVARFEAELVTAKASGVEVLRTVLLGGRRYEVFNTAEEYQQFAARAWQTLQLAEPIVAKHKLTLAVENHKDFRASHLVQLLQKLSSEYVGVCLDTGNNIALLEDPWQVVDTLAPWTKSVHIKDMSVEESADGFLLAEVPLGAGFLDLPRIVECVSRANPRARFNLEMITRDPLSIPCLTDKYWATLAEVPAIDLARTLTMVKHHARPTHSLPRISKLSAAEQIRIEGEHVTASVRFASGV